MVSANFRESAYAQETGDVWLVLATIGHEELSEDIRVVNDLQELWSRGLRFAPCPFEIQLPSDTDEGPPRARVRIDNVSQDVVEAVRGIDSPAAVRFELVLAAEPDTVEVKYGGMQLRDVRADLSTVTGTVGLDALNLEPFPAHSFSPTLFPGLF